MATHGDVPTVFAENNPITVPARWFFLSHYTSLQGVKHRTILRKGSCVNVLKSNRSDLVNNHDAFFDAFNGLAPYLRFDF